MAGQDYCTERGEAEEDKAEDGVDEAEKIKAGSVPSFGSPMLPAVNSYVSWTEEDGHFDAIDRHLEILKPATKH